MIAHSPLRIFLSYGHDNNEELVCRIYADLKKRGHDVWFDKNEIKFGDEWRRSIINGILKSHRVLSLLSKYSTRDPGVCRDEIAIAIGMKGGNIQWNDFRLLWIMGAPGVGKSAFAAQLTHTRGDTVIAAQFCEWDKPDHLS